MKEHRILFIGVGKLGGQILDLFLRIPGKRLFLLGGRDVETLRQRMNLSMLAAIQLGFTPEVNCVYLDLMNIENTANIISHFQPDLIFSAATLQPLGGAQGLPPVLVQRLAVAPLAPRLPFALLPVYKLMQSVRLAGAEHSAKVLNAIFPDMIHPILAKVGLAPTTGIGDLANNIPAIRLSIAQELSVPIEQVDVRLVMARWVSYWMSRTSVATAPFSITVLINGKDCTHLLEREKLFDTLPTNLKRSGGETGLLMTATSAAVIFDAILRNQGIITHVPGPHGLPGGYPVRVDASGVEVALPSGLTFEKARSINEAGLRLDGIERIDDDGTVFFTDEAVSIYQAILGYECQSLPLVEIEERTKELYTRYKAVALK